MIKIADIYVSNDGCGPYALKLTGVDAAYFEIINKEVYFKDEIAIIPKIYNAYVYLTNLSNTVTQSSRLISVDRRNCIYTTTTSPPIITTTTSTTTPPVNPACLNSIISYPINNGTTDGDWSGCGVFRFPFYTQKLSANIKPVSSISFKIDNRFPFLNNMFTGFNIFMRSGAVAYSDYVITIDLVSANKTRRLRYINTPSDFISNINIGDFGFSDGFDNPNLVISFIQTGTISREVYLYDFNITAQIVAAV